MADRNNFFQFNYVPYPLWRRKMPLPLRLALEPVLRRYYPIAEDRRKVPTVNDVAGYLARFGLLPPDVSETDVRPELAGVPARLELVDTTARPATTDQTARMPAQWEPTERIMLTWPVNFPPLWAGHAEMVAAIAPAAEVQINVNHPVWAQAVQLYLGWRGGINLERITYYHLPTDDIWIRDYGPVVCLGANGERVAVNMIYDPLPNYPQARDDAMPDLWAAHEGIPVHPLELHNEGGNLWSDGAGTLLMTNQVYILNDTIRRDDLLARLHHAFEFEKLVLLPRLRLEETGHVDLLVKLANADTVLASSPDGALLTGDRLRRAADQLRRERNAAGDRYNVAVLPTPPLYVNWFGYPIRRSYTNALTVNGRVLVPTYKLPMDEHALEIYEDAMPGYKVVPIDCSVGANGGGAVHCLTKDVPQVTPR